MSEFCEERVPIVPGLSTAECVSIGEQLTALFQPEAFHLPQPIDLTKIMDQILPKYNISVYPVGNHELPDQEAKTIYVNNEIQILLRQEFYDQLFLSNRMANRARATLAHEIIHAIIHLPYLRRVSQNGQQTIYLNRYSRSEIPPYQDPEWQAWSIAGSMLIPLVHLRQLLPNKNIQEVADIFCVSSKYLNKHIKRLRSAKLL